MGNCTFDAHDIGGHVAAREDWVNHYYGKTSPSPTFYLVSPPHPPSPPPSPPAGVNAVLFIVDSADR